MSRLPSFGRAIARGLLYPCVIAAAPVAARGTFKGELDPDDARNKVIVNLDKAPRNARGMVEYEADFFLLRPVDAARGNRKIIYDVLNRGRKLLHWRLMDAKVTSVAASNDPKTPNAWWRARKAQRRNSGSRSRIVWL